MQRYDVIENGIANQDIKALREALGSEAGALTVMVNSGSINGRP